MRAGKKGPGSLAAGGGIQPHGAAWLYSHCIHPPGSHRRPQQLADEASSIIFFTEITQSIRQDLRRAYVPVNFDHCIKVMQWLQGATTAAWRAAL